MPGDTPAQLSDNATVAVLQATQLDHERRITAAETKFDQIRTELHDRDTNLYRKIDEVAKRSDDKLERIDEKLDANKTDTDNKLAANARIAAEDGRKLQYWVMGGVGALVLNLIGIIFFLATHYPATPGH